MRDFQKLKFMGQWFEVERYYTVRDYVASCISVSFDRFENGKIYVNNDYTNRLWVNTIFFVFDEAQVALDILMIFFLGHSGAKRSLENLN